MIISMMITDKNKLWNWWNKHICTKVNDDYEIYHTRL